MKGVHDFHNWQEVCKALCAYYPREIAKLVVDFLTLPLNAGRWSDEEVVAVLARAAGVDAAAVMDVVGAALLDKEKRSMFGVVVLRGLFEAIGLTCVSQWVQQHGPEALPWMARHFKSPFVDKEGNLVVPPLIEWLFRENESNQKAFDWFLSGQGSSGFYSEAMIDPVKKRRQMQPFMSHELRRVREWAEYVVQLEEREAQFFQDLREEDERN
jgi:hypothetical protein